MNYKELRDQIEARLDEIREPLRLANIAYGEAVYVCKKSRSRANILKRNEAQAVYNKINDLNNALLGAGRNLLLAQVAENDIVLIGQTL